MSHVAQQDFVAIVAGEKFTAFPEDLYIPPVALEVFLESFSGPLDLLWYLIKKQNIDILDIPVAKITEQYLSYIELMEEFQLELIGDYLLMATMLAEIKSRMLLPVPTNDEYEETDPRAELVKRLQDYEQCKWATTELEKLSIYDRDVYPIAIDYPQDCRPSVPLPTLELAQLHQAFIMLLKESQRFSTYHVNKEKLSIRERMSQIMSQLSNEHFTEFYKLFNLQEGRLGIIVTFLALLQLFKETLIQLTQNDYSSTLYIKAVA